MLADRFTTGDVLEMTGVTARQLQWWDEKRVVVPEREGRNRIYSTADLVEILVIEELRRKHISLQQVRRVLRFLRREVHSRLADIVQGSKEHHLLLDGKHVYLESDSRQIVDLMRNTNQPMLLICLTDTVSRLKVDVNEVLAKAPRKPVSRYRSKRRAPEVARTA
ncbi:MerR family transcriptional regulator [Alloacidobacterium dinghuense]|uniref:MerR family transcriptional regulator n=1 Tax=Alloacidobacterium dinghuense TaxID=2763107 RepID=A0A7G8BCC6_9BACT|nr:MerR family transcriptional regulator [Alloacidobacterium dinghuense]QNI30196.1 MerR family transcriptional regulator [Alloacidobacterium dinghuense]